MIWLGRKRVKLTSVRLPGDLEARKAAPHVAELAGSMGETGGRPIHVPVLHAETLAVICGRDRMAAHYLRGDEEVEVELVDCTLDEAEVLEHAENTLRRKPDAASRPALIAAVERLVAARREAAAAAPPIEDDVPKRGGRPLTLEGEVRREAAKRLRISEKTVARHLEARKAEATPPTPCIRTLGVVGEVVEAVDKVARQVQADIDKLDALMRSAQATVTRLHAAELLAESSFQHLKQMSHDLAYSVRVERPAAVCPWCKLVPQLRMACTACYAHGYVTAGVLENTPAELLDEAEPLVAIDGKFVPRSSLREPPPALDDEDCPF